MEGYAQDLVYFLKSDHHLSLQQVEFVHFLMDKLAYTFEKLECQSVRFIEIIREKERKER